MALWLEPEAGILPAENTNADILVPRGAWRRHQQLPPEPGSSHWKTSLSSVKSPVMSLHGSI